MSSVQFWQIFSTHMLIGGSCAKQFQSTRVIQCNHNFKVKNFRVTCKRTTILTGPFEHEQCMYSCEPSLIIMTIDVTNSKCHHDFFTSTRPRNQLSCIQETSVMQYARDIWRNPVRSVCACYECAQVLYSIRPPDKSFLANYLTNSRMCG